MHLAFLTPEYPHPKSTPSGGLGTSIQNLAVALVHEGIKVSVFVYGQKEDVFFKEKGIHFHFIRKKKYKFLGWFLYRKHLQRILNGHVEKEKINAVEAPDWTGITAFMRLKCPLVIRLHGSDIYFCHLEKRPQKKKNYWFEKKALQGADHLLSVSAFTAGETKKLFGLRKKIQVIPNSVDIHEFQPAQGQPVPNSILYFGSVIRKKGVLELAGTFNEVIRSNPRAKLIIAGKHVIDAKTGTSTKELMEQLFTHEARARVEWLGQLPYSEIRGQIAGARVIVLPSFAEALPMTWLEAMAMEKPLVSSNIGWAKELMIDGVTGFTVDPKDHQTYAKKILELLNSPNLARQMGKAARKQVRAKFSSEVVVRANLEFYKKVAPVNSKELFRD